MDLDNFSDRYDSTKDIAAQVGINFVTEGALKLALPYVNNKSVLNLGLGNGKISKILSTVVDRQVVIEGSGELIKKFKFDSNNTIFIEAFFEDFMTKDKFEVILANHVLEHVDDPVLVLKHIRNFLTSSGKIFITVPNANSIHRLIGVEMNLLKSKYELNESDITVGHQRVYDSTILEKDIEASSLKIFESGGYNLKLVSLEQMKDWPQELLNSIYSVSLSMSKDICSNLWYVCENK